MLFDFNKTVVEKTDLELAEIYGNKEGYQIEFYNAAVAEIEKRKIDVSILAQNAKAFELQRTEELKKGKKGETVYIVFTVLGIFGFLGLFGGCIYAFSSVKDSDGTKYYLYDKDTRKIGKVVFYTTIIMWTLIIVLNMI